MKTLFLTLMASFICCVTISGANSCVIEFKIQDGKSLLSDSVKCVMENNSVSLFTMLNDALSSGSERLNFNNISIVNDAKHKINQVWKYIPFTIWSDEGEYDPIIYESLFYLPGMDGYRISNIPVRMFPNNDMLRDRYGEVSLVFTSDGKIMDFVISLDGLTFKRLLNAHLYDRENRLMILHWLEQLKTACESRDVKILDKMFMENIWIKPEVTASTNIIGEGNQEDYEDYERVIKLYVNSLKRAFNDGTFTDFEYSIKDIDIVPNIIYCIMNTSGDTVPRYYMVWCKHEWHNERNSDTVNLFMLWDFKDLQNPAILVKAWTHPDDPNQLTGEEFILTNL